MYTVLLVIHSIIVLFLICMVLIQRSDSDGLSGMSGGGGNQFLTGRGAANLLTRITAFLAAGFMITSLSLAVLASRMTSGSIIDSVPASTETAPAAKPMEKMQPKETKQAPAVPKPE
jgi:preprotein translocase subunit SecG